MIFVNDPLTKIGGKEKVAVHKQHVGFNVKKITQASRLRYRTRYFTDSGIIGSKEFVSLNYLFPNI